MALSRRILVIDDEEDNRELVAHILRDGHYEVQVAADGGQALALITAARPDLVMLDPSSSSPPPEATRRSCAACARAWRPTS